LWENFSRFLSLFFFFAKNKAYDEIIGCITYDRKRLIPTGNLILFYHPLRPWVLLPFVIFLYLFLFLTCFVVVLGTGGAVLAFLGGCATELLLSYCVMLQVEYKVSA
jgi:hypothetical protein